MNYPTGIKKQSGQRNVRQKSNSNKSFPNRGMTLEEDINNTNEFYLATDMANIHKKPTPIQVVNVHYPKRSAAVITEGYFQKPSTTDYNGVYKNKYIDFEAKETKNKTLFPLANIQNHQIKHVKSILKHGGISFFIIRFIIHDETYLLPSETLLDYWKESLQGGKKSIPYTDIQKKGYKIPFKLQPKIDYLKIIDQLYF